MILELILYIVYRYTCLNSTSSKETDRPQRHRVFCSDLGNRVRKIKIIKIGFKKKIYILFHNLKNVFAV